MDSTTEIKDTQTYTVREERIIAGFEEIQAFAKEHGRIPQHGEDRDIFERLYAVRLDRIRASSECVELLRALDNGGLLSADQSETDAPNGDEATDEELLAALGVSSEADQDVTRLKHVRPRAEIKAAEEIAQRTPCDDFKVFEPTFKRIQKEIEDGERRTIRYQDGGPITRGDLFIIEGQKVMVAELGKSFVNDHGRPDRRLRVVYDDGTESNLLMRSLQRALYKDPAGRRILDPESTPLPLFEQADFDPEEATSKKQNKVREKELFSDSVDEDDQASGWLYVLRSRSDDPFVAEHRELLHKIGYTRGDVHHRVAIAAKDPTLLMAAVDVVASYRLANADGRKLEMVLHRFFAAAWIDVKLRDRFGGSVEPREWFLVPLAMIQKAIELIRSGDIEQCRYDLPTATIVEIAS